ncbi:MAG TPA: TIGR03757 family integrating conjugative element protein, partial [Pseudomonas sp.]|nr:TIGR03757 family integrating conjugative element protein [Pseudomonas sp.]
MPAHSFNLPAASRRPLAARLAAGLCAALLGPIAAAADVL